MDKREIQEQQFALFVGQAANAIKKVEPTRQAIKGVRVSHRTRNTMRIYMPPHECYSTDAQNDFFLGLAVQIDESLEYGRVDFYDRDGELATFLTLPAIITQKVDHETKTS